MVTTHGHGLPAAESRMRAEYVQDMQYLMDALTRLGLILRSYPGAFSLAFSVLVSLSAHHPPLTPLQGMRDHLIYGKHWERSISCWLIACSLADPLQPLLLHQRCLLRPPPWQRH